MNIYPLFFILFVLCLAFPLKAAPEESNSQFSIAAGLGHYDSLTLTGSDQQFYLMPRWSWYKGNFYIENLDLGFNLFESTAFSLDLSTKQSLDALMFKGSSIENAFLKGISDAKYPLGLPWNGNPEDKLTIKERSLSYLAGLSLYYRAEALQLSSGLHQDISNVHHGFEWLTEGRYLLEQDQLSAAFSLGARLLSTKYSNYYFGIPKEQTLRAFEFAPGSSWLSSARLELAYQLRPGQRLLLSIKREWLPQKLMRSYMLHSTTHDIWFFGYSWSW